MYLLDVFRRKLDFPDLKRSVRELADLHHAKVVLVEDKASGTSLIQELRADNFSRVQAAPTLEGDKVMRLHAQTAKIEGGFVLFPKEASWLDTYLRELVTFPNSKNDDQVDSTVFALAWSTLHGTDPYLLQHYKSEVARIKGEKANQNGMIRVRVPAPTSTCYTITGRQINVPVDRIIEVTEEEIIPILQNGGSRVD
jgi:predicted phage terminase large subunit-like protein